MPEQTIEVRTLNAMLRIPLDQLHPGPNARGDLGDVSDLAVSIRAIGLQKPLLVTPLDGDGWQILDGHRRHAAARQLGLPHLDAILRRDHGPAHRLQQQLAIHTQAAAFDPIAEAQALHVLMWQHNLDRGDIARAVGKSPGWVRDRVLLLQLEPTERDLVRAGRMPLAAALSTIRGRLAERAGQRDRKWHATATGRGHNQAADRPHCPTCRCGRQETS
jgi:ParB family chromosome partitioning protein